ncbi:unnamed protein product, partial [Amoebophrya sp. A25]|eukprot:GSA25T00023170001.1
MSLNNAESFAELGLGFQNVSYRIKDKQILGSCFGRFRPGEVCAIMGGSGSGKSTLLNVLSARQRCSNKVMLQQQNVQQDKNKLFTTLQTATSYVMQDDELLPTETVLETVRFSTKLRRPDLSKEEAEKKVNNILEVLGLENCKHVQIGSALKQGVSGGQRKRASVAVELVTDPTLLFLDEPTSGLDAGSALRLLQFLHLYARARNATVVCTIHQPSVSVMSQFDRVLLLQTGRVLLHGPLGMETTVVQTLAAIGRPLPLGYSLAEWLIHVAETATEEEKEKMEAATRKTFTEACRREREFYSAKIDQQDENGSKAQLMAMKKDLPRRLKGANWFQQSWLLTCREFRNFYRDTASLILRLLCSTAMPIFYWLFWYRNGPNSPPDVKKYTDFVQGRVSLIILVNLSVGFLHALPVVVSFPSERAVFLREYSSRMYNVVAYVFSKFLIELIPLILSTAIVLGLMCATIGVYAEFGVLWLTSSCLGLATSSIALLIGAGTGRVVEAINLLALIVTLEFMSSGSFFPVTYVLSWVDPMKYLFGVKFA